MSTLFSVRTSHVITRVAQDILRASKVILSSVMSLLNILSLPFLPIFPPATSPTPLTGIRLTPCAASLGDGLPGHLAGPIPNTVPRFSWSCDINDIDVRGGCQRVPTMWRRSALLLPRFQRAVIDFPERTKRQSSRVSSTWVRRSLFPRNAGRV